MASRSLTHTGNSLLQLLPRTQREAIAASCEEVELTFGDSLSMPDEPFEHVYFPLTAHISLLVGVSGHPPLEMGMIGSEGMLGSTLLLGLKTAPLQSLVQGTGTALRMSPKAFSAALRDNPGLTPVLSRYLFVLMLQLSRTTACTRFHEVDRRLVRWLLMTHDRAHSDEFHLTHQFMADMLGVRRSAVTIAAGVLQQQALIHYTRGDITILDRKGLEALSCECYKANLGVYRQWLS